MPLTRRDRHVTSHDGASFHRDVVTALGGSASPAQGSIGAHGAGAGPARNVFADERSTRGGRSGRIRTRVARCTHHDKDGRRHGSYRQCNGLIRLPACHEVIS